MKLNKKAIIIIIIIIVPLRFFYYKYKEYKDEPYMAFISAIKEGEHDKKYYLTAYVNFHPLILNMDIKAMKWISRAYQGGFGIEVDLIKANIWKKRSECGCFETGENEYRLHQEFLEDSDLENAKIFLLSAANNGNKSAIMDLKDNIYLDEHFLQISIEEMIYWENFEYDKLYPYIDEIKNKDVP